MTPYFNITSLLEQAGIIQCLMVFLKRKKKKRKKLHTPSGKSLLWAALGLNVKNVSNRSEYCNEDRKNAKLQESQRQSHILKAAGTKRDFRTQRLAWKMLASWWQINALERFIMFFLSFSSAHYECLLFRVLCCQDVTANIKQAKKETESRVLSRHFIPFEQSVKDEKKGQKCKSLRFCVGVWWKKSISATSLLSAYNPVFLYKTTLRKEAFDKPILLISIGISDNSFRTGLNGYLILESGCGWSMVRTIAWTLGNIKTNCVP